MSSIHLKVSYEIPINLLQKKKSAGIPKREDVKEGKKEKIPKFFAQVAQGVVWEKPALIKKRF